MVWPRPQISFLFTDDAREENRYGRRYTSQGACSNLSLRVERRCTSNPLTMTPSYPRNTHLLRIPDGCEGEGYAPVWSWLEVYEKRVNPSRSFYFHPHTHSDTYLSPDIPI